VAKPDLTRNPMAAREISGFEGMKDQSIVRAVTHPRFSKNLLPLWLALIVLVALDVALFLWTPSGNSYKSPWAVPIVSGFILLLLFILLAGRQDQSLGAKIQAREDAGSAGPPEVEQVPRRLASQEVLPVPAFSLEVLKAENVPPLSPDARALVQRGRSFYRERLRIYRRGVWLLLLANLVIAWLGRTLGRPYPIPWAVIGWLVAAFLALMVLAQPRRMRLILAPFVWRIFGLAWVVVTVIVAAVYALKGVRETDPAFGLLAFAAIGAVAAQGLRIRQGNRKLRQEVLAHPPLKLLFLWVFGSYSPAFLFLGFAAVWRFLGTLQLLNGAGFMGDTVENLKSFALGKSDQLIVKTPEAVAARIAAFDHAPNRMAMYGHHTLLCNDRVWKLALHTLLQDTDVVLMDLRGFSPANRGATYELGQLIDRFPMARCMLLADATTDVEFLTATLRSAWDAMAIDSPNRRASSAPVRVFQLAQAPAKQGEFPQLPTIAREGDRLIEILCERAVAPMP
jgi:hypothetical protein